jgi:hypothetical protein
MLVRIVVDEDVAKSIVLELDVASRVALFLVQLGHKVTMSEK